MCEMCLCSCSAVLKWLISICEVLLSSNRVCPDPFGYVECCTNSTILLHLARFCSVNLSRLYHACRHRRTGTVSKLTKCRLPIIPWIMATRLPLYKFICFLQLIFVLYSNYIYYTFIIMLLSLKNDSFAKQMHSSIGETTIFSYRQPMQRHPSCIKSVVVLFVLFIWKHSFHHHTVQDRK